MKVKVTVSFSDKVTYRAHKVGEVLDFPDQRAQDVISRGLAVALTDTKKDTALAKTTKRKTTKK